MRATESIGGGVAQTPSPCNHQYIKRYETDHIAVYECYWCHNQHIKYGEDLKRSTDRFEPSLQGEGNTTPRMAKTHMEV